MRILYTARSRRPAAEEEVAGVEFRTFDSLLRESDVVSLHVPLTPQTRHLIGAPQLALMKPDAILLNTSRGPVVDEAALVGALAGGRLWAAGLDVYEDEPRPHPALLRSERTVLTPHIGSATTGARSAMCVTAVRNVIAVLGGEHALNPVNPEVLV
jgi:glyoxylate reductase